MLDIAAGSAKPLGALGAAPSKPSHVGARARYDKMRRRRKRTDGTAKV